MTPLFLLSCSLSYDRSAAICKTSSPYSAIWCRFCQFPTLSLPYDHPVAAYDLLLVFPSLLSSLQNLVLEGSSYTKRDQSIYPSLFYVRYSVYIYIYIYIYIYVNDYEISVRSASYIRTRGAVKSLAWPGRKQARKHVRDARNFNKIETQAVIKFLFLQGKELKENHANLTETLACFLPVRAKDLSAPLLY